MLIHLLHSKLLHDEILPVVEKYKNHPSVVDIKKTKMLIASFLSDL